jgi:ketosteroid isomerase-like protein
MAPSENEDLIWSIVNRWNDGDRDVLLEVIDDDTELHSRLGELRGRPYIGPDGFREWIADIDEQFSGFHLNIERLEELEPGLIIASGSIDFRGRKSDLPWEEVTAWLLEIDEGRLRKMQIHPDRETAFREARIEDR